MLNKIKDYDHTWAQQAFERWQDEMKRIEAYYENLLEHTLDEDKHAEISAQYEQRKQEISMQYKPRVQLSVINSGIFHLRDNDIIRFDESR